MTGPFAEVTPTGLIFKENADPTFDDWQEFLLKIVRVEKCIGFALGDCLNYGRPRYGEKYIQAEEITGLAPQTLRDYAWVASAVPRLYRKDTLTFNHHKNVAGLKPDDQEHWLKLCEKQAKKGEPIGTRRLARSIEAGELVPAEKIAAVNEDKGFQSHILQITRLVAWHRQWKESGRFVELSASGKAALLRDFSRLKPMLSDLNDMGCFEFP